MHTGTHMVKSGMLETGNKGTLGHSLAWRTQSRDRHSGAQGNVRYARTESKTRRALAQSKARNSGAQGKVRHAGTEQNYACCDTKQSQEFWDTGQSEACRDKVLHLETQNKIKHPWDTGRSWACLDNQCGTKVDRSTHMPEFTRMHARTHSHTHNNKPSLCCFLRSQNTDDIRNVLLTDRVLLRHDGRKFCLC